jgi:endonuclease/exonuclease/phosphatase family metal-dependent hydrolase
VALSLLRFSFLLATFSGCVRFTPPSITPVSSGSCRSAPLQWFAPDDPRERARLDAWCAGVGGAAIHPAEANSPADTIGMDEITFVSWNVHVGSGDIRAFVKDLTNGDHTDRRPVHHYVLMLQEAVRTHDVPPLADGAAGAGRIPADAPANPIDIVKIGSELGLSLIYVPSMRNGRSAADPAEDRGSAILSTLPLSEPVAVELPGERQRRVVIIAKAGSTSVAVVHLDALGGHQRLRIFWTPWMRDVQVRATASALPAGPLVVGADLNTWHGRDELAARFLGQLFRATPLSVDRKGLGLRVLDYMFFRAAPHQRAHYRQVERRYGSDHRPLVGWVE